MTESTTIQCHSPVAVSDGVFEIDPPEAFDCWVACYRRECCWMVPKSGTRIADVPDETQMLLFKRGASYIAYLPLVKDGFRASLLSDGEGRLLARVESGDLAVTATRFDAVLAVEGADPYAVMDAAAAELRGGKERRPRPEFMKYFGWCSWNAFYDEVSEENIHRVLQRFEEAGVMPGFLIVDAGWQQSEGNYLTGYGGAAKKFPNGMKAAIRGIKDRYGVRKVLLWQCYNGYWNGVAGTFPDNVRIDMDPPERLLSGQPFGPKDGAVQIDTISHTFYPEHIMDKPFRHPASFENFYDDYLGAGAAAGADGVKIDAISWIEACGKGHGGRVAMMHRFLAGAERGVDDRMGGNIIWCSSCSNDFILKSNGSGVVRTSMDFFPDKPRTHGMHIHANAMNSFYMGAFVNPDWDMFQSALGAPSAFHAAARAISGGPVYSTDTFGQENFDILRRLVLRDGTVPLCDAVAKPTLDSLFADVQKSLLKVFNTNPCGHVLALFNCACDEGRDAVRSGSAAVADIPPLRGSGAEFAVFSFNSQTIRLAGADDSSKIELGAFGFELLTVVEARAGFAPVGDPSLYNSGGVVRSWESENGRHRIGLMPTRAFLAYCAVRPHSVACDGVPVGFHWENACLRVDLEGERGGFELEVVCGG